MRLSDRRLHWKLLLDPERFLGEGCVDGTVTVERGSLYDLLDLGVRSLAPRRPPRAARLRRALVRARAFLRQYNPAGRARRNAAHAYDMPDSVYESFLDPDRQYSCAYFANPGMTLEEAQEAKKRRFISRFPKRRSATRG